MKKLSVKLRVTIWYTVFVAVLTAVFMVILISSAVRTSNSLGRMRLTNAVDWAVHAIKYNNDGSLKISLKTDKTKGVDIVVYNMDNNIIYKNKTAVIFDEGFGENVRTAESDNKNYLICDRLVKFKNHPGLWLRGSFPVDYDTITGASMVRLAFVIFPFAVVIMAIGGYAITKRAFEPVARITRQANSISGGSDLSKRVCHGPDFKAYDEITELAATFDKMFQRLQSSFEKERQFTSDVSHELRTPTSVIISQCEYLLSNETNDDKRDSLEAILKQSQKMSRLISELLTLSRTSNSRAALHFEDINLSETAEIVAEEFQFNGNAKNIKIISEIESGIHINADQTFIMQFLINLISNGIQYGKENGFVSIRLSYKDGVAFGEISDNGIGISESDLTKIWNRVYQANPSRSNPDGSSGLGLAMVKWIIENHGGEIKAESVLNEGSTFSFKLPNANKETERG